MTGRVQNLVVVALALLLFSFHVRLKEQADPTAVEAAARQVATPKLWKGKVAPQFELAAGKDAKFLLADHVGKEVIILNFFATWCAPCRAETPELNRFAGAMKGKSVLLVGIDVNERADAVAAYIRDLKVSYPVLIDDGTVAKLYGVKSYPTTIIIGADGKVALYETGAILNADVAFAEPVNLGLAALSRHQATTRDAYLAAVRSETYYEVRDAGAEKSDDVKLNGRALKLAETMHCMCGCSDTLLKCKCAVAKGMKTKLRDAKLDGTNDVAVMQQINAEFCMKEMS